MATSSKTEASATETLNPSIEEIQPINGGESIEQVQQKAPEVVEEATAEKQEERVRESSNDKIQPLNILLTDGQDIGQKRKREDHPLWKTSLCSYYRSHSKSCSHGETCRYAHGEEELRPRPDNSWDPTSERAKKLMKSENGEKIDSLDAREDVLMATDAFSESSNPGLEKCFVHLPRKWSSDDLKSFLDEQARGYLNQPSRLQWLGILYKTAKKRKGMPIGFVSFESTEQMENAIEGLDGKSMGNKQIQIANVIPRSFEKKARSAMYLLQSTQQPTETFLSNEDLSISVSINGCEDGDKVDDDLVLDASLSRAKSVRDVVAPLAHMPYSDQLEHKKNSLMQSLKRLTRNARKACPDGVPLPEWILRSRDWGGLSCKLEGILESPIVNGYRNKCEFSVGYSLQGKPTVGFLLGNFREGVTAVEEPVDCPNVSRIACKFASIFQGFLQHSDLPIWNRFNNTGFWRQLTVSSAGFDKLQVGSIFITLALLVLIQQVREGRTPGQAVEVENLETSISEVLLMVQVCSVGFDDEIITREFERMAQALALGSTTSSCSLPLTALVVQDHRGISNAAPADAPLRPLSIPKAGIDPGPEALNNAVEPRINDYISNLRFCISPTAFFQVNTLAAEKLYSLAGDWAGLGPDTLLFDICCGTGTIGLTLARRVGMVVGIEMNASAVSDAHRNAEINGIKNCRFVCAKAEDVMKHLLEEYLNVPHKQDQAPHTSKSNGKDDANTGDKDTPVDNVLDLENCSNHEVDDAKSGSSCPSNGREEHEDSIKKSCISEDKNTPVQQYKDVVAIVDPPRVGLHPTVIKVLRTHPRLRRLVYISCNPESLVANAIELCTPSTDKTKKVNKNNRGWRSMSSAGLARHRAKSMPNSEPFQPIKAMAVDLFPHTPHCEMVMLLER
ncbi:hypothetical protein HHK36_018926 [Tetracentron sinense]|uniref:C3H1-type domain-containing protein n=1 Tax=Tetracentron sinense TaxID=13715 RepID=A0A834Z1A6_TETSI|nr:hypothetical protein HHK36_018926 [Tetracentron sinense]